jgi:hypothetical protein
MNASVFLNLPSTKERLDVLEQLRFTFLRIEAWEAARVTADT